MESKPIKVAALGRPLFPGMLYDCRKDSFIPGSSIYLYEKGDLTDTQFQPVSKPPPPIVNNVLEQTVSLILQESPSGGTVQYRVEYKQVEAEEGEQWLVVNTADEDVTLTGLESGKQYLIRYRIVGEVGVSEASDTVSNVPSSAQDVIVGGNGGSEFYFKLQRLNRNRALLTEPFYRNISKISITYGGGTLNTIQVNLNPGQMVKVGEIAGSKEQTFDFDKNDQIVAATLWPNIDHTRCGGLEFVVAKISGERKTFSVKCDRLGDHVSVDVKSGRCSGIMGRSGYDIDALGFYFI